MTKRPCGIYFVMIWVFFSIGTLLSPVRVMMAPYEEAGVAPPLLLSILPVVLVVGTVALLIMLFQLRRGAIWTTVVLFSLAVLQTAIGIVTVTVSQGVLPALMVFALVILGLNGATIWYLTRASFRKQCTRFRSEKESQAMMKHAQKGLLR